MSVVERGWRLLKMSQGHRAGRLGSVRGLTHPLPPGHHVAQVGVNPLQPSLQGFIDDVRQGALDFTLTKPRDAQVLASGRLPGLAG